MTLEQTRDATLLAEQLEVGVALEVLEVLAQRSLGRVGLLGSGRVGGQLRGRLRMHAPQRVLA